MNPFSFDVDAGNFQQIVLEGSMKAPVLVDFWAEWCGPCKMLKPVLEKLAEEYQGKFILAKVNTELHQELASQFGIRGIPNVKAFYRGQLVDEFSGALPEASVREFLDRIIPSPADDLRVQAAQQRDNGDLAAALQTLAEASRLDAGNEDVRLDAAEILTELNDLDEAQRLLDSLSPLKRMDDRAQQLEARLNFARGGKTGDDLAALEQAIQANPDDMDSRLNLANALIARGQYAPGMDALLDMIQRDRTWNEEAARKTLLSVFSLLGSDPLVSQYRRKLASALNA